VSVDRDLLDQLTIKRYVRLMWDMTIVEQMQFITMVEESRDLKKEIKKTMLAESWRIITHHLARPA